MSLVISSSAQSETGPARDRQQRRTEDFPHTVSGSYAILRVKGIQYMEDCKPRVFAHCQQVLESELRQSDPLLAGVGPASVGLP